MTISPGAVVPFRGRKWAMGSLGRSRDKQRAATVAEAGVALPENGPSRAADRRQHRAGGSGRCRTSGRGAHSPDMVHPCLARHPTPLPLTARRRAASRTCSTKAGGRIPARVRRIAPGPRLPAPATLPEDDLVCRLADAGRRSPRGPWRRRFRCWRRCRTGSGASAIAPGRFGRNAPWWRHWRSWKAPKHGLRSGGSYFRRACRCCCCRPRCAPPRMCRHPRFGTVCPTGWRRSALRRRSRWSTGPIS